MALKNCKECGHEISTNAKTCPKCGEPQTGYKRKTLPRILFILVGLAILIHVVVYYTDTTPPPRNEPDTMDAYIEATRHVERVLRNPHTAKFAAHIISDIKRNKDDTWDVKSYVDSKNDFGGEIRNYYHVKVQHLGDKKFKLLDINIWR